MLGLAAGCCSPLIAELEAPPRHIARLGRIPGWSVLDDYQYTITREEFTYLLNHCYAHKGEEEYRDLIRIEPDRALILRQSNLPAAGWYDLRFQTESLISKPPKRFWRKPTEMDDLPPNSTRPLEGVCIAIDPGHIGGKWVTWDDRYFTIGRDTIKVREGEMVLAVAKILQRDLSLLGATVLLTRNGNYPVTKDCVETLEEEARAYLISRNKVPSSGTISQHRQGYVRHLE